MRREPSQRYASVCRYHSIILAILTAISCGNASVSRTSASSSSPVAGSTISLRFSARARKSGSFSIAANAARSAASRSAGTPGVVRIERPNSPVEAAAYFVVSEALQNVAKYAHATRATVTVRRVRGRGVVDVADVGDLRGRAMDARES